MSTSVGAEHGGRQGCGDGRHDCERGMRDRRVGWCWRASLAAGARRGRGRCGRCGHGGGESVQSRGRQTSRQTAGEEHRRGHRMRDADRIKRAKRSEHRPLSAHRQQKAYLFAPIFPAFLDGAEKLRYNSICRMYFGALCPFAGIITLYCIKKGYLDHGY